MIKHIDNICSVEYSTLDDILSMDLPLDGPAVVDTTWVSLPIASGSLLTISESKKSSGRQYESNFRALLKESVLIKKPILIRITLTDEDTLLIGDKDLPVRIFESHSLTGKDLAFSHTSWHYPYDMAV